MLASLVTLLLLQAFPKLEIGIVGCAHPHRHDARLLQACGTFYVAVQDTCATGTHLVLRDEDFVVDLTNHVVIR